MRPEYYDQSIYERRTVPPPPVLHPVFAEKAEGVWTAEVHLPERVLRYEVQKVSVGALLIVRGTSSNTIPLRRHRARTVADAAAEARKVCRRRSFRLPTAPMKAVG